MSSSKSSSDIPTTDRTTPQQRQFSYRTTATFLNAALTTGCLGSGPREKVPKSRFGTSAILLATTIPWTMLIFQMLWSGAVVGIAYALANKPEGEAYDTLSVAFWSSRLNVSPTVSYGVGWALFVLLGFFIRESTSRYREAQVTLACIQARLLQAVRLLRQMYPANTWHHGDHDRIAAHLVAYPIALKMMLRNEREVEQLNRILHPDDVTDVINADSMHIHCSRVVRAYFSSSEDDAQYGFGNVSAQKTPAGWGIRYFIIDILDTMDMFANVAVRIASFRPAVAYVNHLHIFLYIWLMFLPLALVKSSGWFTFLWAPLITYGVGMLFTIAEALNEPFGFDVQDIKLNRVCSEIALSVLYEYTSSKADVTHVIDATHETPSWLESSVNLPRSSAPYTSVKCGPNFTPESFFSIVASIAKSGGFKTFVSLFVFTIWSAFIIFLTWGISRNEERGEGVRWWLVYIPIDSTTTGYVSLGVFLLLGFWMVDAYNRYWRALQIWQAIIAPHLENIAFLLSSSCRRGLWHVRDRERILSFLCALPYVTKNVLRDSTDFSELSSMLSPHDLQHISQASNPILQVLHVLYGYVNVADAGHEDLLEDSSSPFGATVYNTLYTMWTLEGAIGECLALRSFPISPSFTLHLRVFTIFWLAVLPLTLVIHDGFLSFLYLVPVAYSIIQLLQIGDALSDPFGFDKTDVPLDLFCDEIRDKIHAVYRSTADGHDLFIRRTEYERASFVPKAVVKFDRDGDAISGNADGIRQTNGFDPSDVNPTIKSSLQKIFRLLPSVSVSAQVAATLWAVAATFLSWGLSKLWDDDRQTECTKWCSPIDVQGAVLGNVGFALFMILSFRASDAIGRYEEGATLIFDMEMDLRCLAIGFSQLVKDGTFHPGDKERVVAHLVQIPLCFRDTMLDIRRERPEEKEGLLNDEDRKAFEESPSPIDHLIDTVLCYCSVADSPSRDRHMDKPMNPFKGMIFACVNRLFRIRTTISRAQGVKRFPVVKSYKRHQHLFTGLWVVLLPFAITSQTGFFTILLAPLVSYGVFGLESIASKLVDPYGHDSIDIPLDALCTGASNSILEGVHSAEWGFENLTQPSLPDNEPGIGAVLKGREVCQDYVLPFLEESVDDPDKFGKDGIVPFVGPKVAKVKPSLYAHLLRSVPWWVLVVVTVWTIVACIVSYLVRLRGESGRWWVSFISVGGNVGLYLSFGTFTLLGFYVQAAFSRYNSAGTVWGDSLRASCHCLATLFLAATPNNAIHKGDHDRIIGHIAAIPLVLKHELRDSRDIREVKGLLSKTDLASIQTADSMITHCVDVLRAYFMRIGNCESDFDSTNKIVSSGYRKSFMKAEIEALERAIRSSKFLKSFEIAPGFVVLLNMLLGLWFLILPFVFAEQSGWFTILWVPLIAYGLFGMYWIAKELQNPFGVDVNDLDLDAIANRIVGDVLFVYKYQNLGWQSLVVERKPTLDLWKGRHADKEEGKQKEASAESGNRSTRSKLTRLSDALRLAASAVPSWMMVGVLAWSGASVAIAYLVSEYWSQSPDNSLCAPWFCSAIAVNDSVKEYVAFALFLLLGFRLYDSHYRYVKALELWQDGVIGTSRLLANRIFESYGRQTWHSGDLERICGHIGAFAICLMGVLRNKDYKEKLLEVLEEEDVERVLSSEERVDYTTDVLFAYFVDAERLEESDTGENPCGANELWAIMYYVRRMENAALECQRMVRIPLPFGYVQHLRIFLVIWLLLLPLGLVESSGWLTILWVAFIAYGVIGIERWALELSDPFGFDVSDVPLEELTDEVIAIVKTNLELFDDGLKVFVRGDRDAFPMVEDKQADLLAEEAVERDVEMGDVKMS